MSMGIILLLILLGLGIGSFVSVVTYRIPKEQTFVFGRSYCDFCKNELSWIDNIPLFSFLFYLGNSKCCDKKISYRYPLIELFCALSLVFLYQYFGFNLNFLINYLLVLLTFVIFVIDIEHQIIPDRLSFLLFLVSIVYIFFYTNISIYSALFSGFASSLVYLFLHLVTNGRGMGLGDVKLAIPIGIMFSFERNITWILTTFVLGGFVAFILLIFKKASLKTKIAFGPFMIISFWIIYFFKFSLL